MNSFPDPLLRFRPEFPILEKSTYLISNSLGAMPRRAAEALAEYAKTWETRGVRAWAEGWWEMSVALGGDDAPLIGASGGSVTTLPNVTIAAAVLLSSLDFRPPRNRVVMIDGEFPTVRYLCETLGPRLGAEIVVVPSPGGGVLKWLCGGPGGAFLWVRPELRSRLRPSLTGWMAHPAPFDFEAPPMRWRDDAFRFLLGTPAIPALYAALRQTGRLISLGRDRGFRCAASDEPARRGGTVAVDFEHALEVSRELNARDVVVDYRPGAGIRMSPHFYTADTELDRAFDAIDEIRASGAWKRWLDRPVIVT